LLPGAIQALLLAEHCSSNPNFYSSSQLFVTKLGVVSQRMNAMKAFLNLSFRHSDYQSFSLDFSLILFLRREQPE
jgi:hypothetical protein